MDKVAIIALASLLPMWITSLYLFSRASWSKMSRIYPSPGTFFGNSYGKLHARINDLNYSSRLYLHYNEEGIKLSVVKRYRLFHPPVFIPWNDISEIRRDERDVFIVVSDGSATNEISMTHNNI